MGGSRVRAHHIEPTRGTSEGVADIICPSDELFVMLEEKSALDITLRIERIGDWGRREGQRGGQRGGEVELIGMGGDGGSNPSLGNPFWGFFFAVLLFFVRGGEGRGILLCYRTRI